MEWLMFWPTTWLISLRVSRRKNFLKVFLWAFFRTHIKRLGWSGIASYLISVAALPSYLACPHRAYRLQLPWFSCAGKNRADDKQKWRRPKKSEDEPLRVHCLYYQGLDAGVKHQTHSCCKPTTIKMYHLSQWWPSCRMQGERSLREETQTVCGYWSSGPGRLGCSVHHNHSYACPHLHFHLDIKKWNPTTSMYHSFWKVKCRYNSYSASWLYKIAILSMHVYIFLSIYLSMSHHPSIYVSQFC